MNKEHIFPEWLIMRSNSYRTAIRWFGKRIFPLAATLPLCIDCNTEFGRDLEEPVSKLFDAIGRGQGISDVEAELLVRWLWKIKGLAWIATHPGGTYTSRYTLRERVLYPIDSIRPSLLLGVSLIDQIDPHYGDLPMGVDAETEVDAVFVSGVFLKIAVIVLRAQFRNLVPIQFDLYSLADRRGDGGTAKLFYPRVNFRTDAEAVTVTAMASVPLSREHDEFALQLQREETSKNAG